MHVERLEMETDSNRVNREWGVHKERWQLPFDLSANSVL
jgi:hypothetical protein